MSIGSNICIACITFAYASSWKAFAKQEIFICIILWLHLHAHAAANPYITSTYICICIRIKGTCIMRSFHLHHHMAAFMSAYSIRIFALDISRTNMHHRHLHLHSHLHPHEGHLHNKIFIHTITRLRSCLHIR